MDLINKVKARIKEGRDNEEAFSNILAGVIGIVVIGVALYIGLLVMGKVSAVAVSNSAGLSANWINNITAFDTQTMSALQLSPIIILVIIASLIIGVLVGSFAMNR